MIQFLVTGQMLQIVTPLVASDSHNYITAEATFAGNEWDNTYKWAHFTQDDKTYHVPFTNNKISSSQHLDLTEGTWLVYLTGNQVVGSTTVTRVTTNPKPIFVESTRSGSTFPELTPEFSEVLAAQVAEALEIANSVKDAADDGDYNGATFTPSVNDSGVISWTNDKGLENPASKNIKGPKGDTGTGITVKGFYSSYEALVAAVTAPSANDCYGVGTEGPHTFYVWDATNEEWVSEGQFRGIAAGFGAPIAYVNSGTGTPSCDVQASGPDTEKVFTFTFSGIKGEKPVKGTDYYTEEDKAEIVLDVANTVTPESIGAIADPENKSSGQFLKYDGTGWVADSPGAPVASVNTETGDVVTRLIFTDVVVPTTSFAEQSDPTYEDFPYVGTISLTGVTSTMIPEVIFDVPEATQGIFANVAATSNGAVYIYASEVPENNITIPTIICWR